MNPENLSKFVAFFKTPPLWYGNYDGLEQFDFPEIDLQDLKIDSIPENIRLGHQMERVFLQLVEHSPRYKVLAYNIPIRKDKISLGEIDFILKDLEKNKMLHVELTYKFYILDPTVANPIHQLIGPNKRDTFYDKKEKIKHQQIPLLHSQEGSTVLRDMNIDHESLDHKVCFKAQVFLPLGLQNPSFLPLNNSCFAGYWMSQETFSTFRRNFSLFYIPYKKQWPESPTSDLHWNSYQDFKIDLDSRLANKNSPMVWLKKFNGELLKVFVVWWL